MYSAAYFKEREDLLAVFLLIALIVLLLVVAFLILIAVVLVVLIVFAILHKRFLLSHLLGTAIVCAG